MIFHPLSGSLIFSLTGKLCIEVTPTDKVAFISEELCIGCGICVRKCPFEAIQIINLPSNLEKDTTHRYRLKLVSPTSGT
jgi:translation initiation factor RLI1